MRGGEFGRTCKAASIASVWLVSFGYGYGSRYCTVLYCTTHDPLSLVRAYVTASLQGCRKLVAM